MDAISEGENARPLTQEEWRAVILAQDKMWWTCRKCERLQPETHFAARRVDGRPVFEWSTICANCVKRSKKTAVRGWQKNVGPLLRASIKVSEEVLRESGPGHPLLEKYMEAKIGVLENLPRDVWRHFFDATEIDAQFDFTESGVTPVEVSPEHSQSTEL